MRWLVLSAPLILVIFLARKWFGVPVVVAGLLVLVVSILIYQRDANRRSWRSIMCGVHGQGE